MPGPWIKNAPGAPAGFAETEAAGLEWLAAAPGGARTARVLHVQPGRLAIERITSAAPTAEAALGFGAALARTHDAGAEAFGCAPPGLSSLATGDHGFVGPVDAPLPVPYVTDAHWGRAWADSRIVPLLDPAASRLTRRTRSRLDALVSAMRAGDLDDDDVPVRLHGDLWSGNVMWSDEGVVLIDPAAVGGHRLTDLAMLRLFGAPYLDLIEEGYQRTHPLPSGWEGAIGLYQVHFLLLHVALFGGSYVPPLEGALESALSA